MLSYVFVVECGAHSYLELNPHLRFCTCEFHPLLSVVVRQAALGDHGNGARVFVV